MKTKVKVHVTTIKFFDSATDSVNEMEHPSRLTMVEAKKLIKDINENNVLIHKETMIDEFEVSTTELFKLKGVEGNE